MSTFTHFSAVCHNHKMSKNQYNLNIFFVLKVYSPS